MTVLAEDFWHGEIFFPRVTAVLAIVTAFFRGRDFFMETTPFLLHGIARRRHISFAGAIGTPKRTGGINWGEVNRELGFDTLSPMLGFSDTVPIKLNAPEKYPIFPEF